MRIRAGAIILSMTLAAGVGVKFLWPKVGPKLLAARSVASSASSDTTEKPGDEAANPSDAPGDGGTLSPAELFRRISPSVVRIVVSDKRGDPLGQGSGFVATDGGLIVTNYHVIKGARHIKVFVDESRQLDVEGIAGVDPDGDLALVKVKGALPPPLKLAGEQPPAVGSRTYAIGNPLGLTNTLSEGLISGVRKFGPTLRLLQTTAAISPGSSGGPLVNEEGHVLGVTTLCFEAGQNLNFAVERERIKKLLDGQSGQVTAIAKQPWVLTMDERTKASVWLAKAAAEGPRLRFQQARIFGWIAEVYARCGDRDGLRSTLEAAQMFVGNSDSGWYQEAVAAGLRAKIGDGDSARETIDASANPRLRIHGHIFIALALHERGDREGFNKGIATATSLAKKQADAIVRADSMIAIVKALAESGNYDEASAVSATLMDSADPMLDAKGAPSGQKRNTKSVALSHLGLVRAKRGEYAEAQAIAEKIFDITDGAFLLTSIAELRAQGDDAAGALTTAQKVKVAHLRNRAMLEVAEAFARQGDREAARDAISEARKSAKEIKEIWNIRAADNRLVGVLAACGEFDSAEGIANALPDAAQRSAAMGRIAVAWARRGDYRQMTSALAKATDSLAAIASFSEIAVLQAKAGHLTAAMSTTSRIPIPVARLEATRAIIKASAAKLSPDAIAEAIPHLPTAEQRAVGYLGLAEGILDRDGTATAGTGQQ